MNIQVVTIESSVPEVSAAIVRTVQQEGGLEIQATDSRAVYPMLNGIARARRTLANEGIDMRFTPVLARVDRDGRKINAIRLLVEGEAQPARVDQAPLDAITTADVIDDFAERQEIAADYDDLLEKLLQHTSESPILSGGDIDAAWEESDVGQETVGGTAPTPDQDRVDLLGEAVGLTYEDDEPLHTAEKLAKRDEERWLLDPRSAESQPGQE